MDALTVQWIGGEHDFALPIGQLRALQKNCDAGPEEIFNRLRLGTWRLDDAYETLRLGLIGGGMDSKEAGPLIEKLFDQHPKIAFKMTAYAVIRHALLGPMDDPVGEVGGAAPPPENGASQSSTAAARSSASPRKK